MVAIFADDISRCIFINGKFCILIKILLKFIPKGLINNKPALIQIMASRRIGDKPLSESTLTRFTDSYMRHQEVEGGGGGGGGGSSHCHSFEDRAPSDEIYKPPIFEWVQWLDLKIRYHNDFACNCRYDRDKPHLYFLPGGTSFYGRRAPAFICGLLRR